jgi:hypothetical protein
MTAILDYIIHHNKSFAYKTDYEKWEYREDVIAGMKHKSYYVLMFIGCGIALASGIFLAGLLGN